MQNATSFDQCVPYFDWYQGSFPDASHTALSDAISENLGPETVVAACRGIPQYDRAVGVYQDAHHVNRKTAPIAVISYGGNASAPPNVRVTGRPADLLAPVLRHHFPNHRVSRLDSCFDVTGSEFFDVISGHMETLHETRHVYRDRHGFPENGQTYYLGSPKSPMRVRCYEKGKQLKIGIDPWANWVRLECQYRPRSAEKTLFSTKTALEIWGASKWTRELLSLLAPIQVQPIKQVPKMDRSPNDTLAFLIEQYSKTFDAVGEKRSLMALQAFFDGGVPEMRRFLGLASQS